jgi:ABC-type Na+ efflux pump permease subunit
MTDNDVQTARPIPAAPGFLASGVRIFDLSLGEMLWSRRTIFMMLVAGAPVVIACLLRVVVAFGAPIFDDHRTTQDGVTQTVRMTGPAIFGLMIWVFYLRFTVPVLGVFYGTSLMADEVEDKTITYLFTRPIRRSAVLFGK